MSQLNRRSWLASLGASAATALTPLAAAAQGTAPKRTRILCIESFQASGEDRMPQLHTYLGGTLRPVLDRMHDGPKLFADAIIAPHLPQALCLTFYNGFEEMLDVRDRIAADPGIRQARAALESSNAPATQVRSQVLIVAQDDSVRMPADFLSLASGLLEVRSHRAPAWHDLPLARVRGILARAGIHPIVNAATAVGEHLPQFTSIIPFESLAARQEAWARLEASPEWIKTQRESVARYGGAAEVAEKSLYKLAPYSQRG